MERLPIAPVKYKAEIDRWRKAKVRKWECRKVEPPYSEGHNLLTISNMEITEEKSEYARTGSIELREISEYEWRTEYADTEEDALHDLLCELEYDASEGRVANAYIQINFPQGAAQ